LVLDEVLHQKSFKDMRLAVDRLPNTLVNFYELMWRRLDESTKIAVSLAALHPRPLTITELENLVNRLLLTEDTSESETWTFEPNGFLSQSDDNEVRLVHFTVQQWLKSNETLSAANVRALIQDPQANLSYSKLTVGVREELPESLELVFDEDTAPLDSFDEISSVSSYSSSILSQGSSSGSQTSYSSILSQLETVAEQYAGLFINHEVAKRLILELLESSGQDGFEDFFSSLLRDYSNDLKVIATSGAQQVAAIMAGDKADVVAHKVVLTSGYLEPSKILTPMTSKAEQEGKSLLLDRFLGQRDGLKVRAASNAQGGKVEAGPENLSEALKTPLALQTTKLETVKSKTLHNEVFSAEERDEEVYVDLERIKVWLTTTPPFQTLMDRLAEKIHAPLKLPPLPPNPMSNRDNENMSWYQRWRKDAFKTLINLLPGVERPLEAGMKRVQWTCVSFPPFSTTTASER
jgi:hypothetical protein